MQKYFEKIIERLEDTKGIAFLTLANTGDKMKDVVYDEVLVYMNTAIEIVNQVAEEVAVSKKETTNDGWIPCSEKTPEFEIYSVTRLWVTMHRKGCGFYFVRTLRWNGCQGRWEWDNGKTLSDAYEVVAWRQFDVLKPYKPEGDKDGKAENN